MKQLKYIGWMICSLFFLVSCDKETEGMSKVLHFSLEGDETMLVTVGTSYNEPGYAITLDGEDVSGNVEIRGEVDASTMYKNKINVTNKTNSSELVSPYIGFLSIFCTELSAPIGRDALCQRPSTTRLTTVNKVLHNR